MIDLDAYRARLTHAANAEAACGDDEGSRDAQYGVLLARDILDQMRAEALPDPAAPAMPAMNRTATTQTMRAAAFPRSGSLRRQIVDLLTIGARTDDSMEVALHRSHQSLSSARNQLVADGWLEPARFADGGKMMAPTRAGNPAVLWQLTPAARRRLMTVDL